MSDDFWSEVLKLQVLRSYQVPNILQRLVQGVFTALSCTLQSLTFGPVKLKRHRLVEGGQVLAGPELLCLPV